MSLLYRYWWNTRIFPCTKKSYLYRAQWRYHFYLSPVRILVSPWLLTWLANYAFAVIEFFSSLLEFWLFGTENISIHSWEILSALEDKIHIPVQPWNILYICLQVLSLSLSSNNVFVTVLIYFLVLSPSCTARATSYGKSYDGLTAFWSKFLFSLVPFLSYCFVKQSGDIIKWLNCHHWYPHQNKW